MTIPASLQAGLAALLAFAAWAWWTIRGHRKRAEAAERRAEVAEAERDGAEGIAANATAKAEHETDQARGMTRAGEITAHDLPDDPAAARDALYDRVRDAHDRRAGAGAGGAAAVRPVPKPGAGGGRDGR